MGLFAGVAAVLVRLVELVAVMDNAFHQIVLMWVLVVSVIAADWNGMAACWVSEIPLD